MGTSTLASTARRIYAGDEDAKIRVLQSLRPYICPFQSIMPAVRSGSRILDVGCGAGLFLLLLSQTDSLLEGSGFDVSGRAIAAGQRAAHRLGVDDRIRFEHRKIEDGLPSGTWDAVSVVDVIHHVPQQSQSTFLSSICDAVRPGGRLIIKDMVARPRWRAAANTVHDLVMARQWPCHAEPEDIVGVVQEKGFQVVAQSRINTLWYGHWSLVMQRD